MSHDPSQTETPRETLKRLLTARNQYPERADAIDAEIRERFERRVSMLVLDMCGFSRRTIEHGIIFYLALVSQMETVARPAVEGNGGIVLKQEADNLFAIFDNPSDAVEAAGDILRGFDAVNSAVPDERWIHGSIGIGYGDTLVIGDEDLFGAEMNIASKLGEDLAGADEILLSPNAYAAVDPERYICTPASFHIGGLELASYRLDRVVRKGTTKRLVLPDEAS